MPEGNVLRDHAAHRDAEDVRALHTQMIHETDYIGRHVLDAITRLCIGHFAGETCVTVIEHDDPQAGPHEPFDQRVRPLDELCTQAANQHDRWRTAVAVALVAQ
jgi:hypothetical protein